MSDDVDFEDAMIASAARTEVHLLNIKDDVSEIKKTLFGNGQPGVVVQSAKQQAELDALRDDVVELKERPEADSNGRARDPATMIGSAVISIAGFLIALFSGIPKPI